MKKECTRCKHEKAYGEFGYHPRTRDRLKSWCAACVREQAKEHYALHKNERKAKREARRLRLEKAAGNHPAG